MRQGKRNISLVMQLHCLCLWFTIKLNPKLIFPICQDAHRFISPYHQSSDPDEEFNKVLHDTGFEVIRCECRTNEYNYKTVGCLKGDCQANDFMFYVTKIIRSDALHSTWNSYGLVSDKSFIFTAYVNQNHLELRQINER
jgi:hypothetical protein